MGRSVYIAIFQLGQGPLDAVLCMHILEVDDYICGHRDPKLVELYEFDDEDSARVFRNKFDDPVYLEEYVRSSNPTLMDIKRFVAPYVLVTRNQVRGDRIEYREMVLTLDQHPYSAERTAMIELLSSLNDEKLTDADSLRLLDFPDDQPGGGGSGVLSPISPKIPPRAPGDEKDLPTE